MTQAYPLSWPQGRPRKAPGQRKPGNFHRTVDSGRGYREKKTLTLAMAMERLQRELDLIGARHTVLSTNVETRLDGLPRSGQREPADPGVALYFELRGKPHCLPSDAYQTVTANVAAVAAHIEATRAIERHGVASVSEMFAGFQALPAPGSTPWWSVLGLAQTATREQIEAAYRSLARERHPDRPGGSHDLMADLNRAREQGLKERGA